MGKLKFTTKEGLGIEDVQQAIDELDVKLKSTTKEGLDHVDDQRNFDELDGMKLKSTTKEGGADDLFQGHVHADRAKECGLPGPFQGPWTASEQSCGSFSSCSSCSCSSSSCAGVHRQKKHCWITFSGVST